MALRQVLRLQGLRINICSSRYASNIQGQQSPVSEIGQNGGTPSENISSTKCEMSTVSVDTGQIGLIITDRGQDKMLGQEKVLNFNDPCQMFQHKTTWELLRAYFVLNICAFESVVNNSYKLMMLGTKVMGPRLFSLVMKPSFYSQFVGGCTEEEIKRCSGKLKDAGIGTLLALPNEEDVGTSVDADTICDRNLEATLNCIKMAAEVEKKSPMMQIKITALLRANLCAKLSELCPHPSAEPELVEEVARAIKTGQTMQIPGLTDTEQEELARGLGRLRSLCELATELGVIVMVDAEYTYVNPALNLLSLAMMRGYNTSTTLVFYTYQNYLKSTGNILRRDLDLIDKFKVCFGAKLVRGAYLTKERARAARLGYPDPVHDTFDDTSNMYHDNMELLLTRIKRNPGRNKIIIASHNYNTMELAIERIKFHGIGPDSRSVFLGQVYGISDHITFLLGSKGYPVFKSIPYGSISETLPYLSRRAQENKGILQGVREEKRLLKTAIWDRVWGSGTSA